MQAAKILVVDDQVIHYKRLRGVKEQLADILAIEFIYAENGQVGKQRLLSDDQITHVFLDVHMPVLDGLTMLQELNQEAPDCLKSKFVIMMTTECSQEQRANGKSLGVRAWMIKPVQTPAVAQMLRAHTQQLQKQAGAQVKGS